MSLEGKEFGDIAVTAETRMNISVALSKVCEATRKGKDEPSEKFVSECIQNIKFVCHPSGHALQVCLLFSS